MLVSTWTIVETSRAGDRRLVESPLAASRPGAAAPTVITVNPERRQQEIIGFGGALTESAAWVLAQLPAEKRSEVIHRYYSPAGGIGYTMARTHLNSCDFSLHSWALDEVPGDCDLQHFTLDPMRRWVLPLLHDARRAAGGDANFRLLVSPWSPPAWMKTNNRMDDGGALRPEFAPAWADYFVRFVRAMEREERLPVWGMTIQNEPEARQTWESCLYTPEQERDFVKQHLGPAFARAGLLDKVRLLGWDHNRDRLEARATALLEDPEAAKYFWGLGLHWYVSNDFAASARVRALHPGKPILFTEGCWEGGRNLGSWEHGEGYAAQMIGDFRHGVAGYVDWNIVLDQHGGPNHVGNFCDAPVLVDTRTGAVTYTPAFHYIAHFSRYIRPGAFCVMSAGDPSPLAFAAFVNPDGTLVVVMLNQTEHPIPYQVVVNGAMLDGLIPARSIHTCRRAAYRGLALAEPAACDSMVGCP